MGSRPARADSPYSPTIPCSNHFLRQWQIVGLLTPKRSAIAVFDSPLAEASTICARRTRLCRAERDRPMRSSSSRSPSLSVRARSGGRPIRAMIRSVHRQIISEASAFVNLFVGQYTRAIRPTRVISSSREVVSALVRFERAQAVGDDGPEFRRASSSRCLSPQLSSGSESNAPRWVSRLWTTDQGRGRKVAAALICSP